MGIARICGLAIVIVSASMVIKADQAVSTQGCAPGIAEALCASASAAAATPVVVLASTQIVPARTGPAALTGAPQHSADAPAIASGIAPGASAAPPMTESMSLVLLGMALVLAAWTLRRVRVG